MEKDILDILIEENERTIEISGKKLRLNKLSYGQIILLTKIVGSVMTQIVERMQELKKTNSTDKLSEIRAVVQLLDESQVTECLSIIFGKVDENGKFISANKKKCSKIPTQSVVELFVYLTENDLGETIKNLQGTESVRKLFQKITK
jgi:hypothetical protein